MKIKENLKKIVSAVLTASMLIGVSPMITPITTYAHNRMIMSILPTAGWKQTTVQTNWTPTQL